MLKSLKEQELEIEVQKLKKEIDLLKKKLKLKDKQLKQQSELLEDVLKENKTIYYKNKYELEKSENEKLKNQLQNKEDHIAQIRGQLEKNSENSSKPSSTDGFKKKIHNNREKTERKQGAQKGHKYHESKLVDNPDEIIQLPKKINCVCGGKIEYSKEKIKRQLINLLTKYYVTEYQGQVGVCNKCGKKYRPIFPKGINNQIQYGDTAKGMSLLLSEYGNVPVDKITEIVGVLTNSEGPSAGSIMKWKLEGYKKMKPIREEIKEEMLKSPVIHNDETPYRLNGKQKYAIGAFTKEYSVIECNGGREKEAFEKMNIYPRYGGTIMGDHYAVNESFEGQVAFCNEHTCRTAKGVLDIRKDSKAKDYLECIYKIKKEVEETPTKKLTPKRYKEVKKEYKEVLNEWKKEFNEFIKGRDVKYYNEEKKLINLLLEYVDGHLLFAKESFIEFTNNLAERGLRPIKSKMKVIGCFREQEYSDGYCCALSIIQTAQKQKLNSCEVLGKILRGEKNVFAFQT